MDSKEYFDAVAGQWDSMRKSFFTDALRGKLIAASGSRAGMTAADIGAGTGFITEGLLKLGLKVIAVDQSEGMLKILAANFPAVDARLGQAEGLPIEDTSVDIALANMYLHHVERPARAIAEMARILKPGGRLVIGDLDSHNHEFLRAEHHDRWMGFARQDVAGWMKDAGLVDVAVNCAEEDCQAESSSAQDKAKVSIFIGSGSRPA